MINIYEAINTQFNKNKLQESEISKLSLDVKEAGGKKAYIMDINKQIAKLEAELKAMRYDHNKRKDGDNYGDDEEAYEEARKNILNQIHDLKQKAKLVDKQL